MQFTNTFRDDDDEDQRQFSPDPNKILGNGVTPPQLSPPSNPIFNPSPSSGLFDSGNTEDSVASGGSLPSSPFTPAHQARDLYNSELSSVPQEGKISGKRNLLGILLGTLAGTSQFGHPENAAKVGQEVSQGYIHGPFEQAMTQHQERINQYGKEAQGEQQSNVFGLEQQKAQDTQRDREAEVALRNRQAATQEKREEDERTKFLNQRVPEPSTDQVRSSYERGQLWKLYGTPSTDESELEKAYVGRVKNYTGASKPQKDPPQEHYSFFPETDPVTGQVHEMRGEAHTGTISPARVTGDGVRTNVVEGQNKERQARLTEYDNLEKELNKNVIMPPEDKAAQLDALAAKHQIKMIGSGKRAPDSEQGIVSPPGRGGSTPPPKLTAPPPPGAIGTKMNTVTHKWHYVNAQDQDIGEVPQ